jgi:hypothetical protein
MGKPAANAGPGCPVCEKQKTAIFPGQFARGGNNIASAQEANMLEWFKPQTF